MRANSTNFIALTALAPLLAFSYSLQNMGVAAMAGKALGLLFYHLHFRRKIVTQNLRLALGKELSAAELQSLTRKIYIHIGTTMLGIARNFALSKEQMDAEVILSPVDRATINAALARGKGVVFVSGHIANWELLAMGMAAKGFPCAIVVKKMNNRISQYLIERQRAKTGIEIIYAGGTIEKMRAALAQGKVIGFMVDQNTTGKKGIRTNFFGVPASSIRGLATLVRETGAAVIPICAYREEDGTHKVEILPELTILNADELPAGSDERILREEWLNTQLQQTAVETLIRKRPEQWLWIHRRWKTSREPLVHATAHLENEVDYKRER